MRFVLLLACYLAINSCSVYAQLKTNVYCGGVNGFDSMIDPDNSPQYRNNNGGLYLHNSGWSELEHHQRLQLLKTFNNKAIAIEVGFPKLGQFGFSPDLKQHHWWCDNLRDLYINYGIKPHIIAVILEDAVNNPSLPQPTFAQYKQHHDDLKSIAITSLVLPLLGPMNVERPIRTTFVSKNSRYQRIVNLSGGLVLDVPPKVFISRETKYRMWVVDAIQYCKRKGLTSVLVVSPDESNAYFKNHAQQMLSFLQHNNSLPSVYVVENYIYDWHFQQKYGHNYFNKVGNEMEENSILGVARFIQSKLN